MSRAVGFSDVSVSVCWLVPLGGTLLEGVDDLSVFAEFTDEALLLTEAAAEHVGAGELDHLGQEGGQLTIDDLEESREGGDEDECSRAAPNLRRSSSGGRAGWLATGRLY